MRLPRSTGPVCLLLACGVALTACDGGGDPVQQAMRETSSANQAATIRDEIDPADTGKADRALIARMIAQQRAGVAVADAALTQSADPDVLRLARALKERQTRDIAELQAWTSPTD